jgi:hypothetical protein
MAGHPIDFPKKSWNGHLLRRQLLEASGVVLPITFLKEEWRRPMTSSTQRQRPGGRTASRREGRSLFLISRRSVEAEAQWPSGTDIARIRCYRAGERACDQLDGG